MKLPQPTFVSTNDGDLCLEWFINGDDKVSFYWCPEEGVMALKTISVDGKVQQECIEDGTAMNKIAEWLGVKEQ